MGCHHITIRPNNSDQQQTEDVVQSSLFLRSKINLGCSLQTLTSHAFVRFSLCLSLSLSLSISPGCGENDIIRSVLVVKGLFHCWFSHTLEVPRGARTCWACLVPGGPEPELLLFNKASWHMSQCTNVFGKNLKLGSTDSSVCWGPNQWHPSPGDGAQTLKRRETEETRPGPEFSWR